MRLLDRYLLRELFIPLGYCLGGFLIFYVAFDLIASLNRFQEKELIPRDVVELYIVKLPAIAAFILPVALLLALLYTLTNHARNNEITAIRAAGVSLWRLCVPYLCIGFLMSLAVFALNEFWVPDSEAKQAQIMNRHKDGVSVNHDTQLNLDFPNTRDNRHWTIGEYNFKTGAMLKPHVYWTQHGQGMHLVAKRAERINDVWTFYDATVFSFNDPLGSPTNKLEMPLFSETPREFANEARFNSRFQGKLTADAAEVPIMDILDYLDVHPEPPQKRWLLTQLHGRIAAPWSCLVVVLIAIPFGAASGRRNIFVGVAGSIVICFVYFILLRLGLALGTGGFVPAWVAAWLPNAFFGITGFWLMLRVR